MRETAANLADTKTRVFTKGILATVMFCLFFYLVVLWNEWRPYLALELISLHFLLLCVVLPRWVVGYESSILERLEKSGWISVCAKIVFGWLRVVQYIAFFVVLVLLPVVVICFQCAEHRGSAKTLSPQYSDKRVNRRTLEEIQSRPPLSVKGRPDWTEIPIQPPRSKDILYLGYD